MVAATETLAAPLVDTVTDTAANTVEPVAEVVAATETLAAPLVDTVTDTAAPLTNSLLETENAAVSPVTHTVEAVVSLTQGTDGLLQTQALPDDSSTNALSDVIQPVDTLLSSTGIDVSPLLDPAVDTIAPLTNDLLEAEAALTDPVTQVVSDTVDPVAGVVASAGIDAGPLVDPAITTVAPAANDVVQATAPVTQELSDTVEPMVGIVASTEPVTTPLVDTVTDTAAPLTNSLLETENAVASPVTHTVGGVVETVGRSERPAAYVVDALTSDTSSVAAPLTQPVERVLGTDGAAANALPDAASVPTTSPILDSLSLPDPSIASGASGELADPSLIGSAGTGLVAMSPGSDSSTDGSAPLQGLFDALGGLDPADQRLLVSAGIMAVTTIAFTPAGADNVWGTCAANARLAFTNMRLIPCMAEETARRYAATAAETLSNVAGGGSAGRSEGDGRAVSRSRGSVTAIRDGFARATGGIAEPVENGDGRLMVQVGVALGAVYLSFLTLWFWATRLRWRPRT